MVKVSGPLKFNKPLPGASAEVLCQRRLDIRSDAGLGCILRHSWPGEGPRRHRRPSIPQLIHGSWETAAISCPSNRISENASAGRKAIQSSFTCRNESENSCNSRLNRRLLEVEHVSHNSGMSGDTIQRVVQPAVTEDGKKGAGVEIRPARVTALLPALTLFQHLRRLSLAAYTLHQMTYDLRRLRLQGLIYRPPKKSRYFVTPYGWKVARLFSRLEARVFWPAMAMINRQ